MACLVNRNNQNKITEVQTPQGTRSKLFDAIHSIPFLTGSETSLEIFKNAYTDEVDSSRFETYDTKEPKLFFFTNSGKVYDSVEEAIINKEGGQMKAGFRETATKKFVPIVEFDTQGGEISQFVTSAIEQGFLSAERVLMPDGTTRFQGKGKNFTTKKAMAQATKFDFAVEHGREGVKVYPDGTLTIKPDTTGKVTIVNADNTTSIANVEDIPDIVREQKPQNSDDLLAIYLFHKMEQRANTNSTSPNTSKQLDRLLGNFKSFLESLGFSATTLEAYKERYNTIYGKDPDIGAIADITNKVVAFAEGNMSIESLSEEVAHIAIEFYNDQNSIVSALTNVHLTPEYKEFSEYYRSKYSEFSEGVELEEKVRKEVLGKILKNEFLDRFSKEGKSEERAYLIDRLKEIWESFVNSVRDRLRPSHTRDLNYLAKKIADSVIERESEDFDLTKDREGFFYDAMDGKGKSAEKTLLTAKAQVESLFQSILKERVPNAERLEVIEEGMSQIDIVRSVNTLSSIAVKQASVLEAALKDATNSRKPLSNRDRNRYEALLRLNATLNLVNTQLRSADAQDSKVKNIVNELVNRIDELGKKLNEVGPRMDSFKNERAREIAEEMFREQNVPKEDQERILERMDMLYKDQSILGKNFGLASQVKNPLVNMIAKKAIDMFTKVQMTALKSVNPAINKIVERGWHKFQKSILEKDKDGKATGFIAGPVLEYLHERDKEAKQVELIVQLTEFDKETVENKLKKSSPRAIINDTAKYRKFSEGMKQWEIKEGNETRMTQKYEDDKKARFDAAGVGEATQEYIKNKNLGRFERQRKYLNPDGTIDKSKMTEADRTQDAIDTQTHKQQKSPYTDGELREGLDVIENKAITPKLIAQLKADGRFPESVEIDSEFKGELVVLAKGVSKDNIPESSRVTLELNHLDYYYRQSLKDGSKTGNPNEQFVANLLRIEAEQGSAYEWLMDNASLTLNDEFYKNMGTNVADYESLVNKYIAEKLDGQEAIDARRNLERVKELQRKRRETLKMYRKTNNPLETGASVMSKSDKAKVRDIEAEIYDIKAEIKLPSSYYNEAVTSETMSDVNLTEDFFNDLEESGLDFITFAVQHMTGRNENAVKTFVIELRDKQAGRRMDVSKRFQGFMQDAFDNKVVASTTSIDTVPQDFIDSVEEKGLSDKQIVDLYVHKKLTEEYAKSKISSYYQRYEPKGYSDVLKALKDGDIKASVLFSTKPEDKAKQAEYNKNYKALKYLDINPDYTWTQDINNEEYTNPKYKTQDYYVQPKLTDENGKPTKYLNVEFFNKFGLSIQKFLDDKTGDIFNQKATKNVEEFEFLKTIIEFRKKDLAETGDSQSVSAWLRPQQHRNSFEAIAAIIDPNKKANLGERLKDFFQVRPDEQDFGQIVNAKELEETGMSVEIRAIPKYYRTRLENPEDLTENIIESVFHSYKQSLLYSERAAAEADMQALLHKVSEQKFVQGANGKRVSAIGKKGQVSNYYDMLENYTNYVLYGVKQTRKMQYEILGKTRDLTKAINVVQSWARYSNLAYNWIVDATSLTTGLTVNLSDRFSGQFYHKSSANRGNDLTLNVFKYIAEEGKLDKSSNLNGMLELFNVLSLDERLKNSGFGRGIRLMAGSGSMLAQISNLGIKPKILMNVLVDTRFIEGEFRSYPEYVSYRKSLDKAVEMKQIESDFKQASKESIYDHLKHTKEGTTFNDKFSDKYGERSQEEFERVVKNLSAKVNNMVQITDTVISEADKTAAQRDALTNTVMMHKGWMPVNLTKRFKARHFNFHTNQEEEGHYATLGKLFTKSNFGKLREGKFSEVFEELDYQERANLKRVGVDIMILSALSLLNTLLSMGDDDDDDTYLKNVAQYVALRTATEVGSADLFGLTGSVVGVAKSPITVIGMIEALEPVSFIKTAVSFDKDEYYSFAKKMTPIKRYDQWTDIEQQINSYWFFNNSKIPVINLDKNERKRIREEKKRQKEEQGENSKRN
jgi:hypothetical protein